ncbi:DNA cytosine methyltransferase [Nonomuraea sp. NPDC050556]|uniref:DNA cytosine methyltransferase n=1 Tax=Nonomuraea sp. NPDC050556 TaxID=3364369 RepID=UPI0037A22064
MSPAASAASQVGPSGRQVLDLFCCAGGASMGYHLAGFTVTGVDIAPQPRYPFTYLQADALEVLSDRKFLAQFDLIHASPPCQAHTQAQPIQGRRHPDLIAPTRRLLRTSGRQWIMENVPGAPLRPDLILCGSIFPELRDGPYGIKRHRWFEFSDMPDELALVPPCDHPPKVVSVFGHGGARYHGVEQWRRVMGISWASRDELAEAIPPAYTHYIGNALVRTWTSQKGAT